MTMPDRPAVLGHDQRLAVARQQLDRLAHRIDRRDARERRLHHVGIGAPITAGSSIARLQQPALTDRADDRVRVVRGHHRQLRDAVLVQQRDRVLARARPTTRRPRSSRARSSTSRVRSPASATSSRSTATWSGRGLQAAAAAREVAGGIPLVGWEAGASVDGGGRAPGASGSGRSASG